MLILLLLILSCSNKETDISNIVIEPIGDSTYAYGDSVTLKMTIYNKGENDMVVYHWQHNNSLTAAIGSFLNFEIISEEGSRMDYNFIGGRPKMPYVDDTLHISPRNNYSENINISKHYGSGVNNAIIIVDDHNNASFWRWPVGKYTISCVYEYKHNPDWIGGKDLWEGTLTSNKVQVEVK
jgi:hypothetical protein